MKIIERIHNVETGEISDIERNMTPIEIAEFASNQAEALKKSEEATEREIARKTLLAKMGLTEEEAKLLLG